MATREEFVARAGMKEPNEDARGGARGLSEGAREVSARGGRYDMTGTR